MGVKFGKAMGADITVLSHSPNKEGNINNNDNNINNNNNNNNNNS